MTAFILISGLIFLNQNLVSGASLSGPWKLTGTLPANPVGQDSILLLMEASNNPGPWKVLDHGISAFNGSKVQATSVDQKSVILSIKGPVSIDVFLKAKSSTPDRWVGTFELRGNWFPCVLERVKTNSLADEKKEQPTPGSDFYSSLVKAEGIDSKIKVAQEIVDKHHSSPASIKAAQLIIDQIISTKDSNNLDHGLKILNEATNDYPFQLSNPILGSTISMMVRQKFELAKAEKLLDIIKKEQIEPVGLLSRRNILKLEAGIYPLVGKTNEGKEAIAKLDSIEKSLDAEFEKTSIPFRVSPANLKNSANNRPRVLELFTGAQCPPCVAADIAFDALDKSYTSGDLILLQYHLHIPGPDPLTNAHSEMRAKYYGINSTPSAYIDGASGPAVGGFKPNAQSAFNKLSAALNENLSTDFASASLVLNSRKSENGFILEVQHNKIDKPQQLLLRLILVENSVRYQGRNGQRIHHQVVRYFLGDPKGIAISNSKGSQEISVNTSIIKSELETFLELSNKRRPFLDDERPLELSNLSVIGLLQHIETKEIVQAAKVPLK